jgi:hypothetical protein
VAAVIDGEVRRVSREVLHDKGRIKGAPQHRKRKRGGAGMVAHRKGSQRRRGTSAAVLQ